MRENISDLLKPPTGNLLSDLDSLYAHPPRTEGPHDHGLWPGSPGAFLRSSVSGVRLEHSLVYAN